MIKKYITTRIYFDKNLFKIKQKRMNKLCVQKNSTERNTGNFFLYFISLLGRRKMEALKVVIKKPIRLGTIAMSKSYVPGVHMILFPICVRVTEHL